MARLQVSFLSMLAVGTALSLVCPHATANDNAKPLPDATRGQQLAERLCVNCHATADKTTPTQPADLPTFSEIANKNGQSAQHIRNILIAPHAPMPEIQLTSSEIEDLIAYIDRVRDTKSGPRLLPEIKPDPPKPEYPDHS
ncbi:MAG: c-type cytochrome [Hyphomicrobiaceae bacterium]